MGGPPGFERRRHAGWLRDEKKANRLSAAGYRLTTEMTLGAE